MIDRTYRVLGYDSLLEVLARYASSPLGRADCQSLKPSSDITFIDYEFRLVSEMRLLLKVKGFISFSDLIDISPFLEKSEADGSYLQPDDIICILRLVKASQQSKKLLRSQQSLCPGLWGMVREASDFLDLAEAVENALSPGGEVRDSASSTLKRIRREKTRLRSDLHKKLEEMQRSAAIPGRGQDQQVITVRGGRYVISLRSEYKGRIQGIVHDYSQTRTTCFLEPVEAIEHNNRLAELNEEEGEEVRRILTRITDMIREAAFDLKTAQAVIGRLDGIHARARFSEAFSCIVPEIGNECALELRGAKNPILLALGRDSDEAGQGPPVPIDLVMDRGQSLLIISGPNRGGKTVSLKTLGLMSLMAQAGIPIPAQEGSRLPVFDRVLAEIGDDQDIQTGESTFSAHAVHLKYLLEHADAKSLVIIDEPGMGTDPDEGAALAMALLEHITDRGAFVAISTHLNRLKTYGLLKKGAITASVEFDRLRKCPTFKLQYGSPGISHALEIAKAAGLPSRLIEEARGYLDQDEIRLNRLIEKLDHLIKDTERKESEAEEARRKHNEASRELHERMEALEEEKRGLLERKKREAEAAIREAREELRRAVNLLKQGKKAPPQAYVNKKYAEVSARLMESFVQEEGAGCGPAGHDIRKGGWVYHKKLKQKGVVQEVDVTAGTARILLGNVKVAAPVEDLEAVGDPESAVSKGASGGAMPWQLPGPALRELNVIGYRVDEALVMVDKTIDRAIVTGQGSLRIIHGFGTGKLRDAIREHLRSVPSVKSFSGGDERSGGDAITLVELY